MTATQLYNSLDLLGWILLFGGLLLYWLKKFDEIRMNNKGRSVYFVTQRFFDENFIEVPTSIISCFLLAILSPHIPTEVIDLKGYLSLLLIGYGGSSALNGIISKYKK